MAASSRTVAFIALLAGAAAAAAACGPAGPSTSQESTGTQPSFAPAATPPPASPGFPASPGVEPTLVFPTVRPGSTERPILTLEPPPIVTP